jgi:hypothetical protein
MKREKVAYCLDLCDSFFKANQNAKKRKISLCPPQTLNAAIEALPIKKGD